MHHGDNAIFDCRLRRAIFRRTTVPRRPRLCHRVPLAKPSSVVFYVTANKYTNIDCQRPQLHIPVTCATIREPLFIFFYLFLIFSEPQDLDPKAGNTSLRWRGTDQLESATCHIYSKFRILEQDILQSLKNHIFSSVYRNLANKMSLNSEKCVEYVSVIILHFCIIFLHSFCRNTNRVFWLYK